ncbi:hypothetical protein D3H64_01645 [Atopobacter sp. AH10]|uniref:hypothetical protein n=1 Tax=Atopobacter sp. AH10 TaxID=2315861 RepID=UPI000EF2349F|nr:hypothetical protein [Atopobacter sp. AH10]RLK63981.1 hypothetical protein D3H64_01645 [Atopobacter sp. AH10]
MIRLPNKFEGENITLEVELDQSVDMSILYPDKKYLDGSLLEQLKATDQLNLTVSKMHSEINEDCAIDYTEVLIKIPVLVDDKSYYFPIVSYVSHPYSLIRGYYLGFYKELDEKFKFQKKEIHLGKEGVFRFNFSFNRDESSLMQTDSVDRRPLILFNQSNLIYKEESYNLLDITDYELLQREVFRFSKIQVGCLLGVAARTEKVIFDQDKFQIHGIKKLEA